MLSILAVFIGLVFTAVQYPDLPVGRALRGWLIEGPALWLGRTPVLRMAIVGIVLLGVALAFAELGPVLTASEYALTPWLLDLSVYLDGLVMVAIAVATVRFEAIGRRIARLGQVGWPQPLQRSRTPGRPRARRRPKQTLSGKEEDCRRSASLKPAPALGKVYSLRRAQSRSPSPRHAGRERQLIRNCRRVERARPEGLRWS